MSKKINKQSPVQKVEIEITKDDNKLMLEKLENVKLNFNDDDYFELVKYMRSKGQIPMSYTFNIMQLQKILNTK